MGSIISNQPNPTQPKGFWTGDPISERYLREQFKYALELKFVWIS